MRTKRFWIAILAVAAAALVLTPLIAAPPTAGDDVVDFELGAIDGEKVKLSDAIEGNVTILKFGAVWCGWCQKQTPELQKAQKAYEKQPFAIIEIDIKEPLKKVKENAEKKKVTYPVLLDLDGAVTTLYGVEGLPTMFVIDKKGKIVSRIEGYRPFEELKKKIDPLLK